MNRIQEWKQQRREYLKQKGKAYTKGAVGHIMFLPALYATIAASIWSFLAFMDFNEPLFNYSFIGMFITAACAVFTRWCWRAMDEVQNVAKMPYVPPVTTNTLPAEDVLVRGSEQPQQPQSEVLVRPATAEQETPAEQLLRSSQE